MIVDKDTDMGMVWKVERHYSVEANRPSTVVQLPSRAKSKFNNSKFQSLSAASENKEHSNGGCNSMAT